MQLEFKLYMYYAHTSIQAILLYVINGDYPIK